MKLTTLKNISLALAIVLGLATFAPVFAQSYATAGATVNTDVTANTPAANVSAAVNASTTVSLGAAGTKAQGRGDQEIDRRTAALTALDTRVQQMQAVTAAFKTSLDTTIQAQISALVTLKAKIDADTDLATLKTDIQSITQSYRVFALILPQGRIAASADRVAVIVNMMNTLGSKLQARISDASAAGNNTTALSAALSDMGSKMQDAQAQAQAALTASATLQPDNGVASVMASNTAALTQARADIKTATADLTAARKDVTTIVNGLKAFPVSASASSTTQTSTQ